MDNERIDAPKIVQPFPVPSTEPPAPKEPVTLHARDWAALVIGLLLAVLWFQTFSLTALLFVPGVGVTAFVLGALGAEALYLGKRLRVNRESVFLTAFTAAIAVSCGVFGDPWVRLMNVVGLAFLLPASCFALAGRGFTWKRGSVLLETPRLFFTGLFAHMLKPFQALRSGGKEKKSGVWIALATALLALPLLAVVVSLLGSADAVFGGLLQRAGDFLARLAGNWTENLWDFIKTLFVGLTFFSLLYSLGKPVKERPGREHGAVSGIPFATVLAMLDAVYLVFAVVQMVFLFGGVETALQKGGYAQYAREGFFQLVAVAGINLAALFVAAGVKKRDGERTVRVLSLALVGLTAVILVSAVFRMCLYIDAYGLSVLRLLTLWAMALIGFGLAMGAVKTVRPEKKVWGAIFAVTLVWWTVLSFVNVDARVADYNVDAYLSGRLESVDVRYLSGLSADVVPALERLQKAEPSYEFHGLTVTEALQNARNASGYLWSCRTLSEVRYKKDSPL